MFYSSLRLSLLCVSNFLPCIIDASLEAATIELHITEAEDDVTSSALPDTPDNSPYNSPEAVEADNLTLLTTRRAGSVSPHRGVDDKSCSGRYSTLSSLTGKLIQTLIYYYKRVTNSGM